jgi:cytochrome c biogenesis protein CcmG/thiol:disulfide interchange protein DsbE
VKPVDQSHSRAQSSKTKIIWLIVGMLFVIGLLVLLGMELFSREGNAPSIGQRPSDFSLGSFSGEIIDTASLRGKIVLINFWSSWCTTCDEEAVMLEEAWSAYQAEGNVAFLGVAYMDTEPDSLDFLETYGVTYPNGPDLRGEISKLYQVSSVPETYVLDAEGTLRVIKIGPFTSTGEIFTAIENAASPSVRN